jgi:hypothetical protein
VSGVGGREEERWCGSCRQHWSCARGELCLQWWRRLVKFELTPLAQACDPGRISRFRDQPGNGRISFHFLYDALLDQSKPITRVCHARHSDCTSALMSVGRDYSEIMSYGCTSYEQSLS